MTVSDGSSQGLAQPTISQQSANTADNTAANAPLPLNLPVTDSTGQVQTQSSQQSQQQQQQQNASQVIRSTSAPGVKVVGGYALQSKLGSGSFATVYLGHRHQSTPGSPADPSLPDSVAIKAIKSSRLTKKVQENLDVEISILQNFQHSTIVKMFSVLKSKEHIYLFLEYCAGGDLQRLIRSRSTGRLTERLARRLFKDLTSGLKFLHEKDVIHRDIKPQNLLLTCHLPPDEASDPPKSGTFDSPSSLPFRLKIADFGFARQLESAALAETLCGSPLYMAPEILQHQKYDSKADLWSAGTVLFEMIAGKPPFNGVNHIDLLRNIQRKAVRLPEGVRVSQECVKLLRGLLNRNPVNRDTFPVFYETSRKFIDLGCGDETSTANARRSNSLNLSPSLNPPTSTPLKTPSPQQPPAPGSTPPAILATPPLAAIQGGMMTPPPLSLAGDGSLGSVGEQQTTLQHQHHQQQLSFSQQQAFLQQQHAQLQQQQLLLQQQQQALANVYGVAPFAPLAPSPPLPRAVSREHLPVFNLDGSNAYGTGPTRTPPLVQSEEGFVMVQNAPNQNTYQSHQHQPQYQTPLAGAPAYQRTSPQMNMLSTSPGTGGALMAMMMNRPDHTTQPPSSVFPNNSMNTSSGQVSGVELAEKMLAASEDIGRRAINIANVGDVRAYLAMEVEVGGIVSVESSLEDKKKAGEKETEGASSTSVDEGEEREGGDMKGSSTSTLTNSKTSTALLHLKEAVSLYKYALRLMKGALSASQRVVDIVNTFGSGDVHRDLAKRCDVSMRWLGGQFNGILERAEAGLGKQESWAKYDDGKKPQGCIEVIYNHARKCRRDGMDKLSLGQLDSARALFKSGGLLVEALLMDSGITDNDVKILTAQRDDFSKKVNDITSAIRGIRAAAGSANSVGNQMMG
eukprot:CAMPEP_0182494298 /NCGR_PEP_ID=MMETSP1321-20130603/3178_1 /TAXON_ID=91990 /ORGANISM="Bolidomonas sp., Strain RCC1657" /LENGTH=908 /DNA_ID=CAMNT_0024697339 /DNA_START=258 /DNA_END=2984 /DNA_ORIENTATION=-